MTSAVKKTPWAERKDDVLAKLQPLGKSKVQRLYPDIVSKVPAPYLPGRQKAREGEDEGGNRSQPLSKSVCEGAKRCQIHVVSLREITGEFPRLSNRK